MIISHSKKYIYLQPVGMDAQVGDIVLRGVGLVDNDAICSALYLGDIKLYPAQNFKSLTLDQYMKKFGMQGFNNFDRKPVKQIMTIVNASLTLSELVELGYLTPEQIKEYSVFSFIRDPIDRFSAIFTESQVRRPIIQKDLKAMFKSSLAKKSSHLLWQDQQPYHMYNNKIVSHPLIYDKFYYSIEKMVHALEGSFRNVDKLQYAHSFSYSTDPVVAGLVESSRDKLNKMYKKDIRLWEKLNDYI